MANDPIHRNAARFVGLSMTTCDALTSRKACTNAPTPPAVAGRSGSAIPGLSAWVSDLSWSMPCPTQIQAVTPALTASWAITTHASTLRPSGSDR